MASPQSEDMATLSCDLPEQYYELCVAGEGVGGKVFFALPKLAVKHVKSNSQGDIGKDVESLKKELVAVKISFGMSLRREVLILQALQNDAREEAKESRFVKVVDADRIDFEWVAMSTCAEAMPLSTLKKACKVPREFICHVFIELSAALRFLHSAETRGRPAIAHKDVHEGNVILDAAFDGPNGFPNLIVIDLGRSEVSPKGDAIRSDVKSFFVLLSSLSVVARSHSARESSDKWPNFARYIGGEIRTSHNSSASRWPVLNDAWVEFGEWALETRANTPPDVISRFQREIKEWNEGGLEQIDGSIRRVLTYASIL